MLDIFVVDCSYEMNLMKALLSTWYWIIPVRLLNYEHVCYKKFHKLTN